MTTSTRRAEQDTTPAPPPEPPRAPARERRRDRWVTIGIPAAIAYLPLLLTHQGMVGADTKTYLYLDPGKLMASAPYVWDSQIGLGTVTHQNIGYLFPMGPFYLVLSAVGFIPDWVAQRLWLGSVLFAAGMGVRYLLGTIGGARAARLGPAGVVVASLSYMLSPYLLDYSARISVILLPWAALPWLIALCARSIREGGWKHPAWFAFVVLAVGGINATALILVGFGPLLWIINAVWVDREASLRRAAGAVGRIAVLTTATALWWIAGLWAEGRFGLPVIRYTESYRTVATVSNAPEVLRGLGYWFFYGSDKLGPWIEPSVMYTQWLWLIALSYLLPVLALLSAAALRWRYRAYFISLIVVGTLIAVASHPWESPSLLGSIFKAFTRTDAGLSLRSTPRAVPLVILGTAVFLGAGIDALGRRLPRLAVPAAVAVGLLIAANIPPMWTNDMVAANLERPEQIPAAWTDAAQHLEARGPDTRVLEVPGADFASYRWGNTVDPVLPGLMDRGYVARELFQWGSPQSANLLNALDRRFHEDTFDPAALAPVARLMGAGDVNVRSDLQYERYRVARPRQLWELIRRSPGLGDPATFGSPDPPNRAGPEYTMIDEVELGTRPGLEEPPPVAAFPVEDARPVIRTQPAQRPLLVAGDGEGIIDAASIGMVGPDQPIFYSGSMGNDPATWERVYGSDADLLVTDTNRRRARRWSGLRENTGYTERAGETRTEFDPSDQRLDVFPGASDNAFTVSDQRAVTPGLVGGLATADSYGNPITYTPDDRPANAFDGDPRTAWRAGTLSPVTGRRLDLHLDAPVTTDRMTLLQPVTLDRSRWLTALRLTFTAPDGSTSTVDVALDDRSRDGAALFDASDGQLVEFPQRTFTSVGFEVLDTNVGMVDGRGGLSGVGLAEVGIPGVEIVETVRPPVDLLDKAGASSLDRRLSVLLTRLRSNPAEPVRGDEEPAMRRLVTLPTARSFSLVGQARLSGRVDLERPFDERPNNTIDRALGLPDHTQGGVTASADVHLPGSVRHRASAALDGDLSTSWTSMFLDQKGHYLELQTAQPVTFDHLDLALVNDGRHSVPTRLRVHVDGRDAGIIDIGPTERRAEPEGTVQKRVPLPAPVTGSKLRFTVEEYENVETDDWYADGSMITMPVAIAEIGVPGVLLPKPGPVFDSGCRDDLLEIDGRKVPVRMKGPIDDVLDRRAVPIELCGPDGGTGTIDLAAGDHVIRTGVGADPRIGIDLDRLLLASERGGAAMAPADLQAPAAAAPAASDVTFDRVSGSLRVEGSQRPYWLVLGQSWSTGWTASAGGHDLGPPVVVNGYGNAWYVDPAVVGSGPVEVSISWTPQRLVWVFIVVSVLAGLACLVLMLRPGKRSDPPPLADDGRPWHPTLRLPSRFDRLLQRPAVLAATGGGTADEAPAGDDTAVVPGRRRAVLAAVAFGLFAALNLPLAGATPLLAVPLGGAVYLVARWRRGGSLPAALAALALGSTGVYIVVRQAVARYEPVFEWPTYFPRAHLLGLLAVFLLGVEAVRDLLTRRRPTTTASPET